MSIKTICGTCESEVHPSWLVCRQCGARFSGFVDLIRS